MKLANALVSVPAGDLAGYRARLADCGMWEFGEPAKPSAESATVRVTGGDITRDLIAVEFSEPDAPRAARRLEQALGPDGTILAGPMIRDIDARP